MKAKDKKILTIVVLLIAALFLLGKLGYLKIMTTSMDSNMLVYDDFMSGLDLSKWVTYEKSGSPDCTTTNRCYTAQAGDDLAYEQCVQGTTIYNKTTQQIVVSRYECEPNICAGVQTGVALPPSDAISADAALSCPLYTNPTPLCNIKISCSGQSCASYWFQSGGSLYTHPECGSCGYSCSNMYGCALSTNKNGSYQGSCGGYRAISYWTGIVNKTHIPQVCSPTTSSQCGLWTFQYAYSNVQTTQDIGAVAVTGGQLVLSSSHSVLSGCTTHYSTQAGSDSIRSFVTDDVSVKFNYNNAVGDCHTDNTATIRLGDTVLPVSFNEVVTGSGHQHNGILQIKRYNDLDLTQYAIYVDGQFVAYGQNSGDMKLHFSGAIAISYVQYEPYFSCQVNTSTEVIVRDKFNSNSQVNINTLTYTPTKYCPKDLGTLIYSSQGLTNSLGSITEALAKGQSLTVPSDQYWEVAYVAYYVNNMTQRCDANLGLVYDTNTHSCVSKVYQAPILLRCQIDSDCPQSPCSGASFSCISNQCIINGKCITQPIPSMNLFAQIQSVWSSFWSWVKTLAG